VPIRDFEPGDTPGYIYERMADHLAARINAGDLAPHKPLPAERRLAEEYGVSLGTARRATELLRERGLVVTLRSKGTFVADIRGENDDYPPTEESTGQSNTDGWGQEPDLFI
jgi:DNA-binding GntR family transcriptional regulator